MKFIKQIKINELLAYNYFNNKANCIKELSLFKQYKLIKIICEFDSCVQKGCIIKDDEFNILKRISSQILIYQYLKNKDEIILLEGIKMYPEDDEIKSILHKNKLEKKYLYTNQFINTLPNDCDYQIQSLCNESACCHYLKYKDLTILINCGSDYIDGIKIEPKYEMISSHVDYILITDISEACIGSFKKGYEIFSEAYIVTTEIIKNLLFFKYPDLNNKRFKIVRDEDCELTKNFNICFKNSGSNVGSYFVCMQSNEINIGYCYHYSFQNHLTTHMMNKSDLNFEFDYLIVGIYDSNNNYCYKKNLIDFLNDLIDRITTSNEVVLQVNGLAEFIELICILEQYVIDKTIGVFVDDKLLKYYEKLLSSQIEFRSMELDNKSVLRKIIIKTELNDLEKSNNLNIKMNNYLCLNQCVEDSKQLIELIKPKIITLFGTKSNLNSFIEDEIIRIKNQFDNDIVIKNVDDKKLNRIFEINLEE